MKLRKSTHSVRGLDRAGVAVDAAHDGAGFTLHRRRQPGNGNQRGRAAACWSGVSEAMTPGFQAPMSSMAALWLASRPAELPAPCWAEVVRKPSLNGFGLDEALQVLAGLRASRGRRSPAVLAASSSVALTARAQREEVVPVTRPARHPWRRGRSAATPVAFSLVDRRLELVDRRRWLRRRRPCVEQVLAVEEATGQDRDRDRVHLAVDLCGRRDDATEMPLGGVA